MNRRTALTILVIAGLAAGAAVMGARPSRAEDPARRATTQTMYLSITGEGVSARAWYRGAPPTGVSVPEALDTLGNQGWRVTHLEAGSRPSVVTVTGGASAGTPSVTEQTWMVLLER